MTRGEWARLPDKTVQAISDQLEARGWEAEYVTDTEMELTFPDPEIGNAMRFSGWWLAWRLIDGHVGYGISDDIGNPWLTRLDVPNDAPPEAVAVAADQAMHLLWHLAERDDSRKMQVSLGRLRSLEARIEDLASRLVVTPSMLRNALKAARE